MNLAKGFSLAALVAACLAPTQTQAAAIAADGPAAPEVTAVERGPNNTVWQVVRQEQVGDRAALRTNVFQELASGLNFVDETGTWQPSREEFQVTPDGSAIARYGQHSLVVENNINSVTA